MKRLLVYIWMYLATTAALAQTPWEDGGEIEDAKVIIEKDRKIELPKAPRNFEPAPPLPGDNTQDSDFRYNFRDITMQVPAADPQIRVFTIKEDPLDKLYANYVKLGIGNYLSPYAELFTNTKRNERFSAGLHAKHLSSVYGPVDRRNSGTGENAVSVFGKHFGDAVTLNGGIKYQRNKYYFYGYDPSAEVDRDTIRQAFNIVSVNAGIRDNFSDSDISFSLEGDFKYLSDRFDARELQANLAFELDYLLSEELTATIRADLLASEYRNERSINRNLFRIAPSFAYNMEPLAIEGGFNVVYDNDSLPNHQNLKLFPFIKAAYSLTGDIQLYGSVSGDVKEQTLMSFVSENPWLMPDVGLLHTIQPLELAGGVRGALFRDMAFDAGFSVGDYKNMHYFVNDAADTTKFAIIYDTRGTTLFNLYGELGYSASQVFRAGLRGDYFGYDTRSVDEAWHKPKYKLTASGFYNIYDKIAVTADAYFMGGIKAQRPGGQESVNLDPIVDINMKLDYLFSDRFAAFLSFNNLLAENYSRYLNYPSQGLLVMGGIGYSF